jgi:hypothetical protein
MNYISVKEAAAQWGVTIQMVRRYCQKGMIPQVIQENGGWKIPEGTVRPGTPEPIAVETKQASFQNPVFLTLECSSVVIFAGRAGDCDAVILKCIRMHASRFAVSMLHAFNIRQNHYCLLS